MNDRLARLTGYRCRLCRTFRQVQDIVFGPQGPRCHGPCPRPVTRPPEPIRRRLPLKV